MTLVNYWMRWAACRTLDINLFFPDEADRQALAAARQVCHHCPVFNACLNYGLHEDLEYQGILAGLTATQRHTAAATGFTDWRRRSPQLAGLEREARRRGEASVVAAYRLPDTPPDLWDPVIRAYRQWAADRGCEMSMVNAEGRLIHLVTRSLRREHPNRVADFEETATLRLWYRIDKENQAVVLAQVAADHQVVAQ